MKQRAMDNVLMGYLKRLPGAMREEVLPSGEKTRVPAARQLRQDADGRAHPS
jgi:hypothetical protein